MKKVSQLALSVQLPDDETFSSYYSHNNELVITHLKSFISVNEIENGQQPNSFYLFGLNGVGKTHLLHASCGYAESIGLSSVCLSFSEIKHLSVEVLEGLEHIDLVCLDNIEFIAGDKEWQQAVFDLFNRLLEQNNYLIISGKESVNNLGLTLPDLVSRLSWGYTEQVKPLQDTDKVRAIQLRAQQRGLMLSDDVTKFLLNRLSRNMSDLLESLDRLDEASIREQRKITIPFIKEILF